MFKDEGTAKAKPSKKRPKPSSKPAAANSKKKNDDDKKNDDEAGRGRTFAGRNPPSSTPASFRFEAALEAWNECLITVLGVQVVRV